MNAAGAKADMAADVARMTITTASVHRVGVREACSQTTRALVTVAAAGRCLTALIAAGDKHPLGIVEGATINSGCKVYH